MNMGLVITIALLVGYTAGVWTAVLLLWWNDRGHGARQNPDLGNNSTSSRAMPCT